MDYDDIRFYRSIARQRARKELAEKRRRDEENKKKPQTGGGWTGWLWGSQQGTSDAKAADDPFTTGEMNDEQRKQLYEVLDYDERTALAESFSEPKDALKLRVTSKLNKGSFGLRTGPHDGAEDILSIVFDVFRANFSQRPEGFDTSISLGGFEVFDGTTKNSLYPQIVHVKESTGPSATVSNQNLLRKGSVNTEDPFFYLKFEKAPLDERADTALTMRMRHMEIIYHRGVVEAVYEFFRPPASQLESVEALLVGVLSRMLLSWLTVRFRMSPARLSKVSGKKLERGWNTLYRSTRRSMSKWTSMLRLSLFQKSRPFGELVPRILH